MGSLIAIVSFIAGVSGLGGLLWLANKRSQGRNVSDAQMGTPPTPPENRSSEPQPSGAVELPASTQSGVERSAPELPEPVPENSPASPPPLQATPVNISQPIASSSAAALTVADAPITDPPITDAPIAEPLVADAPIAEPRPVSIKVELSTLPTIPAMVPTPTPKTILSDLDELQQAIAQWGETGKIAQIGQLNRYVNHIDPDIRTAVASALGAIAHHNRGKGLDAMVAPLGKLSRDAKPDVSVAAVEALGQIRSNTVLPWLKQALKHPNPDVIKAASTAIQALKFDYGNKPLKPLKPLKRTGQKSK